MVIFKRVLVCGSDRLGDWQGIFDALDALAAQFYEEATQLGAATHIIIIHEGRGRGVGGYADGWAVANRASVDEYPSEWMPAGTARNKRIFELAQPDVVLAFSCDSRCLHMVSLARKAGIAVHVLAASGRKRPQRRGRQQHRS
ncbi:SLOG family protein [Antarcticirhabdus aurantiaca]|uniref:SLOG family protein n=1 Tax=Antarcticirhabdus aurantiaca TaxID=2606717 RepID=A0ACD4NM65_9HYPH|nr:SLOG family protein [Antarcticirhabdus aurantiaca]WAJ27883.1 SLOG family protein [Jeongeuplla avenae]